MKLNFNISKSSNLLDYWNWKFNVPYPFTSFYITDIVNGAGGGFKINWSRTARPDINTDAWSSFEYRIQLEWKQSTSNNWTSVSPIEIMSTTSHSVVTNVIPKSTYNVRGWVRSDWFDNVLSYDIFTNGVASYTSFTAPMK